MVEMVPDAISMCNSSFSAVMQAIYQQTQSEIHARNTKDTLHFGDSTEVDQLEGYPYEPLLDPALSYISDLLAADDLTDVVHPCLTYNEFVAYQEKASEVAALLKEDSPELTLKLETDSPVSPDSWVSSLTDEIHVETSGILNLESFEGEASAVIFSEPWRNEVLLNSLRGPSSRCSLVHENVYESIKNKQPALQENVTKPAWQENATKTVLQENFVLPDFQKNTIRHAWQEDASRPPWQGGITSQEDNVNQKTQRTSKSGRALKPRKESTVARKKGGMKAKSSRDEDQGFVNINDLLLQSAQAVGVNNTKHALELLNKVKQHTSPYGNGAQRLAYYFAEAMDARFSGTGWPLYLGLLHRQPSPADILKATYMYMASCPCVKAYHYFINKTILNMAEVASKLYILELMVTGFQYPSLFQALANRRGGPPQVHLIAIGFPHYSMLHAQPEAILEGVQKTCSQLADYAASCGVPFEYTAWAGNREDLQMQDFVTPERAPGEVLVVISAYMLRYVMDDTVDSPSLRSKLLKQGRDINPDVYIQGIVTGSYSTPFFTRRFREALFHFESMFDMLDTFIQTDNPDRIMFESEVLGKAIMNIVACEGTKVVDRVDKFKHWQAVTEEVGFKQLPLNEDIKHNVQVLLTTWHKEYTVTEDSQYLLMGWKGRMLHAMSTWIVSPS